MKKLEKIELSEKQWKQISVEIERAYRRGFHHGVISGKNEEYARKLRYSLDYDYSYLPLHNLARGNLKQTSYLENQDEHIDTIYCRR